MGKIEFYGFRRDFWDISSQELTQVIIPPEAEIVTNSLPINKINMILFSLPIILIVMVVIILKQAKSGFINKEIRKEIQEENIKQHNLDTPKKKIRYGLLNFFKAYLLFVIFALGIIFVHEYLHAIPASLMGYDVRIAIGIPTGGSTWVIEDMTKIQTLFFSLTPFFVLGVIPALVVCLMRVTKKNYLINWSIAIMSCLMIYSCSFDIVHSYNVIKNIPNGAYVGQMDDIYYWYNK